VEPHVVVDTEVDDLVGNGNGAGAGSALRGGRWLHGRALGCGDLDGAGHHDSATSTSSVR